MLNLSKAELSAEINKNNVAYNYEIQVLNRKLYENETNDNAKSK